MVREAFGVNLGREALYSCMGLPVLTCDPPSLQKYCASTNFLPSWKGKALLNGVTIDSFVKSAPGFAGLVIYYPPGTF